MIEDNSIKYSVEILKAEQIHVALLGLRVRLSDTRKLKTHIHINAHSLN